MNEPIGRRGSLSPARARRTASETASMASSWPTTRSCRRSSMWSSFCRLALHAAGSPGCRSRRATIAAMSSASTSSLSRRPARLAASRARPPAPRAGSAAPAGVPYLSSAARAVVGRRARPARSRAWSASSSDLVCADGGDGGLLAPPSCCFMRAGLARAMSASSCSSAVEARLGGVVLLLAQRLALDLELDAPALELVELDGHRVDLHPQPAGGLVDEVDGLVGQEAVGDVAVGERRPRRRAPSR